MNNSGQTDYAILFTDIEGSTRLAQEFPDKITHAIARHHAILDGIISSHQGQVFEIVGDAYCVAFKDPVSAMNAALEIQTALANEPWKEIVIKIRMGLHFGPAEQIGTKFSGYITMARTQRIMSAAYGGQILVSDVLQRTLSSLAPEVFSFRDLGERRLKDLIQPMRIYQALAEGLQSEFPPLKTLDARPNNLPSQLTSFIGREEEMKKLRELLSKTPLLSLIGSGGSGKTRLALQLAADMIDVFESGVWFVELEKLADPVLLPHEIATALRIEEEANKSPEELLIEYVKTKQILIILDNSEHMLEACARLSEKMLRVSPRMKLIITSREPLRCEGEFVHRINTLNTPDPSSVYEPEALLEYESVELFVERARSVSRDFEITKENALPLAKICYELDGIPLAIELAAARIKVLSVDKIHERLNDRFKLLTGGKRTALPRQQTLRAMIDWSYDLLSEEEKVLWARLSVFAGGFTLEAAEEICSDENIDEFMVLDLLSNLTEKSIILYDQERERYKLLESLRQYGEEKLNESGDRALISSKHLTRFMKIAEESEAKLSGKEVTQWITILDRENSNFERALQWAISDGSDEEGARLAAGYGYYWLHRGYLTTGRFWCEKVLENCSDISLQAKSNIMSFAGVFANMLGDSASAEKHISEGLEIAREMGDKNEIASCLNNLASVVYERGDYTRARELIEETLVLDRETGDPAKISFSLMNLGTVARLQGDFEEAQNMIEESLAIRRKAGNKIGIASSLINLAMLFINKCSFEEAAKCLKESLEINTGIGNRYGIADATGYFGVIEAGKGNFDKAEKLLTESLAGFREIDKKNKIADVSSSLGYLKLQLGDTESCRRYLDKALEIQNEIGDKFGIALTMLRLGKLSLALGELEIAEKFVDPALSISEVQNYKRGIAECCATMGFIKLSQGSMQEGGPLFMKCIEISKTIQNLAGIAAGITGAAVIFEAEGNSEAARRSVRYCDELLSATEAVPDKYEQNVLDELRLKQGGAEEASKIEDTALLMDEAVSFVSSKLTGQLAG